jgi:hypothetical protein
MSNSYEKPDDVPLEKVRLEIRDFKFQKDHPALFSALSQIQSTLNRMDEKFEKRFDSLEKRLASLEKGFDDLSSKVNKIDHPRKVTSVFK